MKTLLIYDDTGYIYTLVSGSYRIPEGGLQFMEIEIPKEKILSKVDVSVEPHQPIYEAVPISEVEMLKNKLKENQDLVAEYINNKYNALLNY